MKDIELAERMVESLDWFKKQSDWNDTVQEFKPLIEQIMQEDGIDNPMTASMPILKKFQQLDDAYGAQMLIAICTEMMLERVGL
jgi:hypothetical protein